MTGPRAPPESYLPLKGVDVVEVGNIVAAPFASQILADLGAEVVKVERPETGDIIRAGGPMGEATFASINRSKQSIALNLKSEAGADVYREIVRDADVVVENLGPGAVERLGIGYEELRTINPGLVYLSIKGFQPGPYQDRPGTDPVAEAMSGLMYMTGYPGGEPTRVGTSIADIGAALYGVIGVFSALKNREQTGYGDRIVASLFESATHWMGSWMAYVGLTGTTPKPMGASHPSFDLYDVFRVGDGEWVFVGVTNQAQWEAFCRATDLTVFLDDDRFETPSDRIARKDELLRVTQYYLRSVDREELIAQLHGMGVPCAPVNDPSDLLEDPQLRAGGLLTEPQVATGSGTQVQTVRTPISGRRIKSGQSTDPPKLGEHGRQVLREAGYDDATIDSLIADGIVDR